MKPEDYGIRKYKFRLDGTLDVFQSVFLLHKNLTELPFNFGEIDGLFDCSENKLKNLKGAPEIVYDFYCYKNKLTSLKGAPKIVKGDFYCYNNKLKSLKYAPKIIEDEFSAHNNKLKNLEGLNLNGINNEINLRHNPNLKLTEKEKLWATLNPGRLIL